MAPTVAIDPEGVDWLRVDSRYIGVKLITTTLGWLPWIAAPIVVLIIGWGEILQLVAWVALSVLGIWAIIDLILVPRRVRAIGYFEREDDLLIRKGLLWQRVVVVPYGRLQYVDIDAGPLMRRAGVCSVTLKTASAGSDADIPGVVRTEGARLRDELSARGHAKLAGL